MKDGKQKIFFASNIKFLRERKKLSQKALAEELGVTRARIAAIEVGNIKSQHPEDYLRFSDFFAVSIDTLLKIDLARLDELKLRQLEAGNDVYIKGGNLRVLAISVDRENNEHVEYVPVKAKAGYAANYADPEYIASLPKYSVPNLPHGDTYRIFPITGDSMLPIADGSDVIGKYVSDWTDIKPDTPCIVILNADQDFVFKMVTVNSDRTLLLRSLNRLYAPYTINVGEVLEIWKFHAYTSMEFPDGQSDMDTVLSAIRSLESRIV